MGSISAAIRVKPSQRSERITSKKKSSALGTAEVGEEDGGVGHGVGDARLARLQALLEEQRQAFNRATIGKIVPVLFEKSGRHEGQIGGKTPWLQAMHCEGPATLIGQVRDVEITGAGPNSLHGRLVGNDGRAPAALEEAQA